MASKVRELYAIRNDKPASLPVFIVYVVPKDTLVATPIRVVQRDRNSVINLSTGAILVMGTQAYYDPCDAIDLMVHARQTQIKQLQDSLVEIEEFRQRVIAAKEKEKNARS